MLFSLYKNESWWIKLMGKKYYEVDNILNNINDTLTDEEISYKKIMTEKPNFNKSIQNNISYKSYQNKSNNSQTIYRKKNFIILKTSNSFIVYNKKKRFKEGHTHTNNYNYAKSLIDLCIRKKMPRRPQKRIMESLKRLTNDYKYLEKLEKYEREKGKRKNGNKNDEC